MVKPICNINFNLSLFFYLLCWICWNDCFYMYFYYNGCSYYYFDDYDYLYKLGNLFM